MKYKSELIKEIVEVRGHKKSSLHYESDCVETWIEEAKGAYPKLCDYESEWLNYISILDDTGGGEDPQPPIGEFPYVVLSDVTEATVDNVVPYAYKSAILKGRTLVNLCDLTNIVTINKANVVDKTITIEPTGYIHIGLKSELSSSEIYTLMLKNFVGDTSTIQANLSNNLGSAWTGTISKTTIVDNCVIRVIQPKQGETEFIIRIRNNGESNITFTPMFLIGEETIEQNYFEGLSSVKMPVLTTSNEDGTKTNILTVNEEVKLRGIGEVKDELDLLTGELTQRIGEFTFDGSENWSQHEGVSTSEYFVGILWSGITDVKYSSYVVSDKLTPEVSTRKNSVIYFTSQQPLITFHRDNLESMSIESFKKKLSELNPTIQYQLAQESVKTVDLNIQDQNGKTLSVIKPIEGKMLLSTSSDTIKPLFTGEIPVEAITQNLASFIGLEMED